MTGPWIQTWSGRRMYLFDPKPEDFDVEEVAHVLSQKVRFNGHCFGLYSIAQHCVIMSWFVPACDSLWALGHEGDECHMPDVPSPLKHTPEMSWYRELCKKHQAALCERWELPMIIPDTVIHADKVLLATECRDLMGGQRAGDWGLGVEPMIEKIRPWTAAEAKRQFLDRFKRLTTGAA